MKITGRILTCAVGLVLACGLSSSSAFASGGVQMDDLQITNNGRVVLSDSFENTSLRGWSDPHEVGLIPSSAGGYSISLNRHHLKPSGMYHQLLVREVGDVELTAKVYVTPPEEQYQYKNKGLSTLYITMYSANTPNTIHAVVSLRPGERANRVGLGLQHTETGAPTLKMPKQIADRLKADPRQAGATRLKGYGVTSPSAVIQPKTWATLTVKLDSKTGTAAILVDGKQIVTQPFDAASYQSLGYVGISCDYGDGAQIGK